MENESDEPQAPGATSENPLDHNFDFSDDEDDGENENLLTSIRGRHDGWTGQRMAMFCAILAETGIVTDACHAVGMSTTSAYGARRRSPLFASAWEESLRLARDRLADALLERSLNGCLEKYYKDGELVAEKRLIDNRLAMQVLRRLDRRAEELGIANASVHAERSRGTTPETSPDWDLMLSALRTGDEDMVAEALIEAKRIEGNKVGEVGEVCVAGNPAAEGDNFDDDEPDPRCWRDEEEQCWMTDFPPPADFTGYQRGRWGDEDYQRECTREESLALDTALDAELAEERAADETERDNWFAGLTARRTAGDDAGIPGAALQEGDRPADSEDGGGQAQGDGGVAPLGGEGLVHDCPPQSVSPDSMISTESAGEILTPQALSPSCGLPRQDRDPGPDDRPGAAHE